MEEWKECKLEQVCENIYSGGTPATMVKEYWNGNLPWLSSGETGQRYIYSTEKTITQLGVDNSSTRYAYKNSTVVASAGQGYTRGQASFLTIDTYVNQSVIVLKPNIKLIDPRYLYFNIDNRYAELRQLSDGTSTRGSLSGKIMKDLSINLPPLPTQQKIAAILSSLDDKIELNNKINANLEQQAQTIFKSWFVDFDPFGGKMPEGRKGGKLSDVLRLKKNPIQPGEDTSLPYLPIDLIPIKSLAIREVRPNEEALSSLLRFEENDILIGAMRVYFHRVAIAPFDGITRTTCFVLETFNPKYFAYAAITCNQDLAIDYAQKTSKGSTMPYAVWEGGLGDFEIPIPDEVTAEKFNNIVEPFLEQIKKSYFETKNLQELRESLLPKLMNGEIEV